MRPILAVDLGGTHMRAALVTPTGTVVQRRVESTPREAECPDAVWALAGRFGEEGGVAEAVIGLPGRVDYALGQLEYAPNLPQSWLPALSQERMHSVLGVPVALANDADVAAVGEARFGAGRNYHDVVYLTLSTGVGAGVVINGRLAHGKRSLAEAGHTIIDWEALARGEAATFEELASGSALARLGAEAGMICDAHRLLSMATADNPSARAILDRVAQAAAIGVVNLAHLYSPEVVVVGGGLGLEGPPILDPIRSYLGAHGPPGMAVEVVGAALGDDAGLVGAAAWRAAL